MEKLHDLEVLINFGKQLIVVETEQEGCYIKGIKRLAEFSEKQFFVWTSTRGLLRLARGYEPQLMNRDIDKLFGQIQTTKHDSVFVLIDFHHYINEPIAIRHIKDVLIHNPNHSLILLSQNITLPDELQSKATHFLLPLPTETELKNMVNDLAVDYLGDSGNKLKVQDKKIIRQLVASLCGMTMVDAKRIAHHAIYDDGIIDQTDLDSIAKSKFELLNQDNVLHLFLDTVDIDELAGFENLKKWLNVRSAIFKGEVLIPGGDKPKGMLLLGVQGCGKSLAAKAVAGSWNLPLLHLDFGAVYNMYIGKSEENLRSALKTAESMQPCVLWIDEIEKGMSAHSATDDTAKRLLGTFLTWLAENKHAVFVVATANNVNSLPPELLRKGRFDETFFVDLPNSHIRKELFSLHLAKRELVVNEFDLEQLVTVSEGFSGAEIEQLIVSAVYHSFSENTEASTELIVDLAQQTRPLSVLMAEKVQALRDWSTKRAVPV